MIDYETFCKIHDCHDRQGLTVAQTAGALGLKSEDGRHLVGAAPGPRREPAARQCP